MKQKALFILVFSFFAAGFSSGQSIGDTYTFAEQQYRQGNYGPAVAEFQRVAFFDSENKYTDVYLKIARSFYSLDDFGKAIKNFDIAYRIEENDSAKYEILFGKVLCYFKLNNYFMALNELFAIPENTTAYFFNKRNLFLAISYFGIEDYGNAMQHFCAFLPPEGASEILALFEHFEKFRKRFDPDKIQTMSIILPGLGQIYSGNFASGLNSLVLVGGIALLTVYIWQLYGALDALMSMSSWYYRYYSGGHQNAKKFAIDKISHKKEEVYGEVLKVVQTHIH